MLFRSPSAPAVAALRGAGVTVLGAADSANLVPDASRLSPDIVLCLAAEADAAFVERLTALQAARLTAAALVCNAIDDALLACAIGVGLHACAIVCAGAPGPDLIALLRVAQARFAHERDLAQRLDGAQQRLDERRLVDRAKGILMRGRAMSEDEAFGVLRSASMQAHARVGQISERVIEAARHADAVNRAGQLRMLSQRIVKLAALRIAGIEPADTRTRLDASIERAEQQIASLNKALADDPTHSALERVGQAWQSMQAALAKRPELAQLAAFDALGEALLAEADALTSGIEAQGLAPTLNVVNLCGRQRMLAQRLAKQTLLATLLRPPEALAARDAAAITDAEFQRALVALAELPISTPEIRESLAQADRAWLQLRGALHEARTASGRRTLAQASETLLELFDELTARYEHSLQVILG